MDLVIVVELVVDLGVVVKLVVDFWVVVDVGSVSVSVISEALSVVVEVGVWVVVIVELHTFS